MSLIINTNISALTAQRNLTRAQSGLERSIQRLSTGLRINGAVDDAAGLAISDRLTRRFVVSIRPSATPMTVCRRCKLLTDL